MKSALMLALAIGYFTSSHVQAAEAFHNMPGGQYEAKIADWEARKLGARTLNIYQTTSGVLISGVYDEASFDNVTRIGMRYSTFDKTNDELYRDYRYVAADLSVYLHAGRLPVWNAIYTPEKYPTHTERQMTDQRFDERWKEWVEQKGYRISSYQVFSSDGERRHAVIFSKDSRQYAFVHGLNAADFAKKAKEFGDQGLVPDVISVGETPFATYAGVWVNPTDNATVFYYDIDSATYQRKFNELAAQGYRLKKIQGYRNGSLFAAIWVK